MLLFWCGIVLKSGGTTCDGDCTRFAFGSLEGKIAASERLDKPELKVPGRLGKSGLIPQSIRWLGAEKFRLCWDGDKGED
jgi:hypothetical protein